MLTVKIYDDLFGPQLYTLRLPDFSTNFLEADLLDQNRALRHDHTLFDDR